MAHAALVGWHIGFEFVFPSPEQFKPPPIPDHGVEGRKEAQLAIDRVTCTRRLLALRPEPQAALDLGMGVAGLDVLLNLPHLAPAVRHSRAKQSTQIP